MLLDHHGVRDGEPLAGAASDRLGGEERLEDPLACPLGNAAAGVLDTDLGPVVYAARRDGDDALGARPLAAHVGNRVRGVDQQVEDYLVELAGQTGNERQ